MLLTVVRWTMDRLTEERDRWGLWLPALFATGIAVYFALPFEPDPAYGLMAAAVVAGGAVALRRIGTVLVMTLAGFSAVLGFTAATLHTAARDTVMLERRSGPLTIEGTVVRRDDKAGVTRLRLDNLAFSGRRLPRVAPGTVRITVRTAMDAVAPGDRVRLRAVLLPVPGPVVPDSFDFRRHAYFQGLGALGFAVSPATRLAGPDDMSFRQLVDRVRQAVTHRVRAALPGQTGGVAAALITGDRGGISEETYDAVRASGLAHLLAISGLHMGLVAGIVLFAVRAILALIEPLALTYPIKKWAAGLSIIAALFYLLLTGATVPTQRAFLMVGIVLLAILVDRTAISMRSVAVAAVLVLAWSPVSLLSASFQLSFAAVIALVAVYERISRRMSGSRDSSTGAKLLRYAGGIMLTTLVAGLATAPFAVSHFNRFAVYGLLANLIAVPIVGLWIMPAAILALILMPLSLHWVPLAAMGWGVDIVLGVADAVAAWPGSTVTLPSPPMAGLAAVAFGGLWLCLWRRRWRWLGAIPVITGLATIPLQTSPHVVVGEQAKFMAVLGAQGGWWASSVRTHRFTRETLQRRYGSLPLVAWRQNGQFLGQRLRCDRLGCIYRAQGQNVALAWDPRVLGEDCGMAVLVISTEPVKHPCSAPRVIDRFDIWREGAHAVWLRPDGLKVRTTSESVGNRPWSLYRTRTAQRQTSPKRGDQ